MSTTTEIDYFTSSDFTFDSSKIQFNGTNASLKLINLPAQTFSQTFASSTGFTFNSSATEFVGGLMRQKDTRPANETFYASLASSINANWSTGSPTGSLVGSAAISGGKLVLTGGSGQWAATGNADSGQTGTFRARVTPNYSGTPGADQILFCAWTSGTANNLMEVYHNSGNGFLALSVFSSTGVSIASPNIGLWVPVSGTTYEIELDYNFTGGATRLFVNGVQLGSTVTGTGTRTGTVNFSTGAESGPFASNFSISNIEVFSTVQHTANYTAPSTLPNSTIYITDTVSIPNFVYSGMGHVQSYQSASDTAVNAPQFTVDGKYWNGSAWVVSNGSLAQSNVIATLNTNIPTLTAADTTSAQVVWQASNTQSTISLLSIGYTGQIYPTDDPSILTNTSISCDALSAFTASLSASGSDSIKFILTIDSQDKYWSGSAWVNSDGTLAQSNTAAAINTNAAALSISTGVGLQIKALLHSSAGTTTPNISNVTVTYSFFIAPPVQPSRCIGYLFADDVIGEIGSIENAVLVVELQTAFVYGSRIIFPYRRTFAFNQAGYVETTAEYLQPQDATAFDGLVETASLGIAPYIIGIQYQNGSGAFVSAATTSNVQIPNQTSVDLSTLLNVGVGIPAPTQSTFPVGILKGTVSGTITSAVSGQDYSAGTAALPTGILKTATGTGILGIAAPADFPTLNQNTTGTASNITGVAAIANGGTGQTSANSALNALLPSQTSNNGKVLQTNGSSTSWVTQSASFTAPTVQKFLSSSGTYTRPTPAPLSLKIMLVGGGGGGGGAGAGATDGGAGGNTTFGSSLLVANGGAGGGGENRGVGTGGSASLGSGPLGLALSGGTGSGGGTASGGTGGTTPLGGAGGGAVPGDTGASAIANSGSGGGGGAGNPGAGGSGGGSGGYVLAIITSPASTYSYAVGAAGAAGGAGTTSSAGGAGGSGVILVEEYYQ